MKRVVWVGRDGEGEGWETVRIVWRLDGVEIMEMNMALVEVSIHQVSIHHN